MDIAPPANFTDPPDQPVAIKVLVVDDDTSIADALVDFMAAVDIPATARFSADAGLEAVRADDSITVVVSDVRMPGRDGISLAGDIAVARSGANAVSVILITAYTSAAVAEVVDRQQIFGFLQKPFRPQALLELVRLGHEAAVTRRSATEAMPATDEAAAAAPHGTCTPGDLLQEVVAGIPAAIRHARRVCTIADCDGRLGATAATVRAALSHLVDTLIGVTSAGTVLTLSAHDAGPDIEFRIDITPAMLGNVSADAAMIDLADGLPALDAIEGEVAGLGGRLAFAPLPTAVALSSSLFVPTAETSAQP